MAGTNPVTFTADQILQASAGPIYHYQAAVPHRRGCPELLGRCQPMKKLSWCSQRRKERL
jgi:hypothetical protein